MRKPRPDRPPSPARHKVHTWVNDRTTGRPRPLQLVDVISTTTLFNGRLCDFTMHQLEHTRRRGSSLVPLLVFGSYQGRAELRVCGQPRPPLLLPILYCCSPSGDCGRRTDPYRTAVFLSGPAPCWLLLPSPEGSLWPLRLLPNRNMEERKKESEINKRALKSDATTDSSHSLKLSASAVPLRFLVSLVAAAICGAPRCDEGARCDLLALRAFTL